MKKIWRHWTWHSKEFIHLNLPNGPDLYVVLSNGTTVNEIRKQANIQLGPLVKKTGAQTYMVTTEEWNSTSGSISIRCRAFDVYFSVATLEIALP